MSTVLLLTGYVLIRRRQEQAHKRTMLACFGVSIVFLICYVTYHQLLHATTGLRGKPFDHPIAAVRYVYYLVLIPHVVLAATVPVLASLTIMFGLRNQRTRHRALARWTFPIWLYVSITGVIVYLMLYRL